MYACDDYHYHSDTDSKMYIFFHTSLKLGYVLQSTACYPSYDRSYWQEGFLFRELKIKGILPLMASYSL